jgi:cell division protease FtsH
MHLVESDPIHKATIIPRGRALGMVMRLPEGDRISVSRDKLKADLVVAMGGRIAEEMIFGHGKVTTGASGDIKMASDMARRMVTEWGMSEKLGFLRYSNNEEHVFLGHSVAQQKNISEETAKLLDAEVKLLVDEAYTRCEKILTDNRNDLETVAQGLLEYETLSGEDIKTLLRGEKLNRNEGEEPPLPTPTPVPPAARPTGRAGSVPTSGGIAPEAAG